MGNQHCNASFEAVYNPLRFDEGMTIRFPRSELTPLMEYIKSLITPDKTLSEIFQLSEEDQRRCIAEMHASKPDLATLLISWINSPSRCPSCDFCFFLSGSKIHYNPDGSCRSHDQKGNKNIDVNRVNDLTETEKVYVYTLERSSDQQEHSDVSGVINRNKNLSLSAIDCAKVFNPHWTDYCYKAMCLNSMKSEQNPFLR